MMYPTASDGATCDVDDLHRRGRGGQLVPPLGVRILDHLVAGAGDRAARLAAHFRGDRHLPGGRLRPAARR